MAPIRTVRPGPFEFSDVPVYGELHIEMPPVLIGLVVWRKPQEGGISCSQEPPLCHRC